MIRLPFIDGWTVGPEARRLRGAGHRRAAPQPVDPSARRASATSPRSADSDQGVHAGYYPGGVFEYAKTFDVPERVAREDGRSSSSRASTATPSVFVNGDFAAHEPNGYAAFAVTLDPFLRFGETNRITVEARAHKDSRWYTGAGIYRPVHLLVADPVHIAARRRARDDARHRRRARVVVGRHHRRERHPPHPHDAHRAGRSLATRRRRGGRGLGARHRAARRDARPPGRACACPARSCGIPTRPRSTRCVTTLADDDGGRASTRRRTTLRHPPPAARPAARPAHQRADRQAARRVRAPRQRPARRRDDRRRRGPARAPAEGGRLQRASAARTTR